MGCLAAFAYGLGFRIYPYNAAGLLLLLAGISAIITSSVGACARRPPGMVLALGAAASFVVATIGVCFLAGQPNFCAKTICHGFAGCTPYEDMTGAISVDSFDDDEGIKNSGFVCSSDSDLGFFDCGKVFGTWYDVDFKERGDDDDYWWGFDKKSDCNNYVNDEFPAETLGLVMILIGYIPAAIARIGLFISVLVCGVSPKEWQQTSSSSFSSSSSSSSEYPASSAIPMQPVAVVVAHPQPPIVYQVDAVHPPTTTY